MNRNDEVWTSNLLRGTKYHKAEHVVYVKLGGLPLIWLITIVDNPNVRKATTLTIKLGGKAKESYIKITEGTPEMAVHHVPHDNFLQSCIKT